jgi:putative DNA primase/helicase
LLARLESVLFTLFPAGKKRRGKFLIGDVLGSPGDSLEVVLDGEKAGLWTDRATGDGGDIFDLIAAYLGYRRLHDFPSCAGCRCRSARAARSMPGAQGARRKRLSMTSARPPPSGTTSMPVAS